MADRVPQQIWILGATGSIGTQTLEIVAAHPDRFTLRGISAHSQVENMRILCARYAPKQVVMTAPGAARALAPHLDPAIEVLGLEGGTAALEHAVQDPCVDQVVMGVVGIAGLRYTLRALEAGKKILVANKESLITGGHLLWPLVHKHGGSIIPTDSEHNAIFQALGGPVLRGEADPTITRLWLTASGGPFLRTPLADLAYVTPEAALRHPRWKMGPKVTIDCATMINKGLELIEAQVLFGLTDLGVVIHPESQVHGCVEYVDGSVLMCFYAPDMRVPLAHALAWPEARLQRPGAPRALSWSTYHFELPDRARFPGLAVAEAVLASADPAARIVFNAADECAVAAFLAGRCQFTDIATRVAKALEQVPSEVPDSLEAILALDQAVRLAGGSA